MEVIPAAAGIIYLSVDVFEQQEQTVSERICTDLSISRFCVNFS